MKGVFYILVFINTALFVILLNDLLFIKRAEIKKRLNNIQDMTPLLEEEEVLRQSLYSRIIKPVYEKFLSFIGNIAPKEIKQKYENIINNAGSPKNITFVTVLSNQIILALLTVGLFLFMSFKSRHINVLLILFGAIFSFMIPISLIRTKADIRKKKIKMSLPNLLDLLYVSVEAGLSFDIALKKTADKMPGPLSEEVEKVLDEMSKGRSRREALRGMVYRTGVEDLSYFVTSIIQAEQLGSNITNMLRIQSKTMRQKRKQRAEEAAMKLPIKMLFPLVFFIFPSLFIVILGPAIIKITSIFTQLI